MHSKQSILILGNELLSIQGTKLLSGTEEYVIDAVSTDTRTIVQGALYIAIRGEKYDGHNFIVDAVQLGASYIAVDKNFDSSRLGGLPIHIIKTEDTTKFLGSLAMLRRKKLSATVIAITGSNGKTTTKDILTSLLRTKFKTVSTRANDNNHIGVPLTIFKCTADTQMLVLEHGTNHFGEIEYTASIAQPDIALITNIGDSHLEYLKDRKGVLHEKEALFIHTARNGGTVFVNMDDPLLSRLVSKYKGAVTYGRNTKAIYTAKQIKSTDAVYGSARLSTRGMKLEFKLPLLGDHSITNILAAAAVAHFAGVPESKILIGLKKVKASKQRLQLVKSRKNLIIDDTYNANPNSMEAALKLLDAVKMPLRKIAVLGDMFELGEDSSKIHASFAGKIKKLEIDEVLLTGMNMRTLFEGLNDKRKTIIYFEKSEMLSNYIASLKKNKALYLFKGSRGMRMEQYIQPLIGA